MNVKNVACEQEEQDSVVLESIGVVSEHNRRSSNKYRTTKDL